jgi:hypothetical protein
MKYAVEMGSGAMIYVPSFIKIGSGIQKLTRWIHRSHKPTLFFKNKESRLINGNGARNYQRHFLNFINLIKIGDN